MVPVPAFRVSILALLVSVFAPDTLIVVFLLAVTLIEPEAFMVSVLFLPSLAFEKSTIKLSFNFAPLSRVMVFAPLPVRILLAPLISPLTLNLLSPLFRFISWFEILPPLATVISSVPVPAVNFSTLSVVPAVSPPILILCVSLGAVSPVISSLTVPAPLSKISFFL